MLAQEIVPVLYVPSPHPWLIISAPTTLQGHRLSGLSHLIFTGCQSGMSADKATMDIPPVWRRLQQDTRGRKSFSRLNNPFMTAGQRQSRLPKPADWGFIQVVPEHSDGKHQLATQRRLAASKGIKGCNTPVWHTPKRKQSLGHYQDRQASHPRAYSPSLLLNSQDLNTITEQTASSYKPPGPSKCFSVHVSVSYIAAFMTNI